MLPKLAPTSYVQTKDGKEERPTFDSIPLHAVLVGDLSKAVLYNGGQRVVVEMVVVDLGSEVELPLGLELVV